MLVYKYLKKEHLLEFKEKGAIFVNTLYNLRFADEAIRDEFEGRSQLKVGSKNRPLVYSGEEFHRLFPEIKSNKPNTEIQLDAGATILDHKQVSNAFVFCASLKLDSALGKKFGYDAYYKITNPERFAEILFEKINEVRTIRCFKADKVKYLNKEIIVTNKRTSLSRDFNDSWDICFTKPKKFHNEKEFRMVFVPELPEQIKPLILSCPKLQKYCFV